MQTFIMQLQRQLHIWVRGSRGGDQCTCTPQAADGVPCLVLAVVIVVGMTEAKIDHMTFKVSWWSQT